MNKAQRLLAGAGVVVMIAGGSVIGLASPAHAAPKITVSPNKDLKGGDVVTVTATGFSPNAPVAIGVTGKGRDVKGPGDAGKSKDGYSKLATADASGKATAEITIPDGPLGNSTPPATTCPPCQMGATNIASGGAEAATPVVLKYAKAGGGGNNASGGQGAAADTDTSTSTQGGSADTGDNATTGTGGKELATTGPRETALMALGGFVLLQLGLIFAVRAARSGPRRTLA